MTVKELKKYIVQIKMVPKEKKVKNTFFELAKNHIIKSKNIDKETSRNIDKILYGAK